MTATAAAGIPIPNAMKKAKNATLFSVDDSLVQPERGRERHEEQADRDQAHVREQANLLPLLALGGAVSRHQGRHRQHRDGDPRERRPTRSP